MSHIDGFNAPILDAFIGPKEESRELREETADLILACLPLTFHFEHASKKAAAIAATIFAAGQVGNCPGEENRKALLGIFNEALEQFDEEFNS